MISTEPLPSKDHSYDIILISGEYWADHPHSGVGVIARILEAEGFSIGIIEKPNWKSTEDFLKLGFPRLFYGITSGSIDSMLQNYTPLKKPRAADPYSPFNSEIPDRAVIVYAHKVKEIQKRFLNLQQIKKSDDASSSVRKTIPIVIGGVEASLRRFTHYDYWDNKLRRSILLDSRADILVYGPGELQIKEIAQRLDSHQSLKGIAGTSIISSEPLENLQASHFIGKKFTLLPSHEEVLQSKEAFCKMQLQFSNQANLIQPVGNRFIVKYRMPDYSTPDLDRVYDLPFTYNIPKKFKEFDMARFSIITHRGCFGNCHFCAIALHQGTKIVSRSEANIVREIETMAKLPEFKSYISDLGGPSANMYGMDCIHRYNCSKNCLECSLLDRSHDQNISLLQRARQIAGLKKIFVRSGIRYDLALDSIPYLKAISKYHISGSLKIAPEHFSPKVLTLMNKDNSRFDEFKQKFDQINKPLQQTLKYYFLTAHPGSEMQDALLLRRKIKLLHYENCESIQIFTPTPMSISSCMYYTGLNPFTMEPVYVPYGYNEKKKQKNVLYPQNFQKPEKSDRSPRKKTFKSSPSKYSKHPKRKKNNP